MLEIEKLVGGIRQLLCSQSQPLCLERKFYSELHSLSFKVSQCPFEHDSSLYSEQRQFFHHQVTILNSFTESPHNMN